MERKAASRRRGEELEQAILEAVWEEFTEVGFAKLSMEAVAKRAGTSKPVLYRRWPSRLELMISCAAHRMPSPDSIPDTGSLRGDTVHLLRLVRERMLVVGSSAMLGMLAEVSANPKTHQVFLEKFVAHVTLLLEGSVILRAVDRGELREERLSPRLQQLPIDLARSEFLITGSLPDVSIDSIVDEVFLPALQANGVLINDRTGGAATSPGPSGDRPAA